MGKHTTVSFEWLDTHTNVKRNTPNVKFTVKLKPLFFWAPGDWQWKRVFTFMQLIFKRHAHIRNKIHQRMFQKTPNILVYMKSYSVVYQSKYKQFIQFEFLNKSDSQREGWNKRHLCRDKITQQTENKRTFFLIHAEDLTPARVLVPEERVKGSASDYTPTQEKAHSVQVHHMKHAGNPHSDHLTLSPSATR